MYTTLSELKKIQTQLAPYVHHTPVFTCTAFDNRIGCRAFFKCENFQRMGAFKMRGAMNAVLNLSPAERARGVVTHSSGNFGQAVALAAGILEMPATVIMPENTAVIKKEAVKGYGAKIIECESTMESRIKTTDRVNGDTGAVILHPSNQKDVIDGNGTSCLELLEEVPSIQAVIAPVGGGGLLAGTSLAAAGIDPQIRIYAGEPAGADDAYRSLETGMIQPSLNPVTIADGLRTQLGECNFPIIKKYVNKIIRVEEHEIISAMQWIWERMKVIIEPSAAVAPAAILKVPSLFKGKRIGIILSGGNVDMNNLPF